MIYILRVVRKKINLNPNPEKKTRLKKNYSFKSNLVASRLKQVVNTQEFSVYFEIHFG